MKRRKALVGILSSMLVLSACSLSNSPEDNNVTEDITTVETDSAEPDNSALLKTEFDFKSFRDAYYNHSFENYDMRHFLGSTNNLDTREEDGDQWCSYYIDFSYEGNGYSIQASYKEKDVLDAVYITKKSNNAMVILYDAGKYMNDLDELMSYDESVTDWYTVELPEKYSVGEFRADLGLSGGALISPEVNPMPTWAPIEEWCYAGFIGKIQSDSTDVNIEFVNGVPQPIGLPTGNHFEKEILQVNPLENSDGWYVMEALSKNDLYTAAQLEELKESGKSLSDEEMFSLYWEFYFIKEGNDTYYYLTLAQKEFSFEEAERIAQSVEMVD